MSSEYALIQSAVNSFGSVMVAGSSAAAHLEGVVGTIMNAYYNAAITFNGQNMGAKKYERIDTIAKVCTILIFATWFLLSGATMLLGRPLLAIFTSDPKVIELGLVRLNVMMIAFFTCGTMNVFPGLTRGMGYSVLPMVCTLVGACLMRILWLYTFFAWDPTPIMLFYLLSDYMGAGRSWPGRQLLLCPAPGSQTSSTESRACGRMMSLRSLDDFLNGLSLKRIIDSIH
jgi:Na+-driven multidrug efflux pump